MRKSMLMPHDQIEPVSKQIKSDRTREAILQAGLEFIWSHPFRDMNVHSLMAATEFSRSVFYRYFTDIHHMMQVLLDMLAETIFGTSNAWLEGVGDPVALTIESLEGLIHATYAYGPFLKAVADAAASDSRFEKDWNIFLSGFDDAGCLRIEADQEQGLISGFDARSTIVVLNRLNSYSIIEAFGQRPRRKPAPVANALVRIWVSTLYGSEWVAKGSSTLLRK